MKNIRTITLFVLVLALMMACSPQSQSTPTSTSVPATQIPTNTLVPTLPATATATSLPTIQPTATSLPEPTPTPFPGFAQNFKFYQAWTRQETTWFYFMNAYVDQTVYALVDDLEGNSYALICPPDATYPQDLRCYSEELFKGKREYKVSFYSDPEHKYPFYEQVVTTNLDTTYLTYDNCEAEYRIYDGKCYSAITCYGENGEVVYTYDDIPYDGNFEGFSGPCQ
jgi:hypothetical protein